jgi:hypothetical protein
MSKPDFSTNILEHWVRKAKQKKTFVNLLKNCCYCLNVLIWHEKSTQNVREINETAKLGLNKNKDHAQKKKIEKKN